MTEINNNKETQNKKVAIRNIPSCGAAIFSHFKGLNYCLVT